MSFLFSQTALKDLERPETCPLRWRAQWVNKDIPFMDTSDTERGKYFEQQVLGAGARADDVVTDLPRLKSGERSIDQVRIDLQARRVRQMLFDPASPEFLEMFNVFPQVYLRSLTTMREGTIDFTATDAEETPWIWDLKLTSDLTSDRTQYGWGNDFAVLDLIQCVHYEALYEEHFGVRPKVGLLICDYSPRRRILVVELLITAERRALKNARFQAAEEAKTLYDLNGWITIPSAQECDRCTLLCQKRIVPTPVIKKVITY